MRKLPHLPSLIYALALAVVALAPAMPAPVTAQTLPARPIPIPEKAEFARMAVSPLGEPFINGQQERFAPGARITGQNNLLVLPGALANSENAVRFLRDISGLVHQVWILTPAEIEAEQAKRPGLFDSLFRR